jgi:hypothetical protein
MLHVVSAENSVTFRAGQKVIYLAKPGATTADTATLRETFSNEPDIVQE